VTRVLDHPTGAAFLVEIKEACKEHVTDNASMRSVLRGEQVSAFVRELEHA
jgi:hypothetical protein